MSAAAGAAEGAPAAVGGSSSPPFSATPAAIATLPRVRRAIEQIEVWRVPGFLYVFGCDATCTTYRLLKVHRATEPHDLVVDDMQGEFTRQQYMDMLGMIREAQQAGKGSGGGQLALVVRGFGLLGCVRFTAGYHLVVVTKRRRVALLGPHVIYEILDTELVPVMAVPRGGSRQTVLGKGDEARYVAVFQAFDVKKEFYFSYTYDMTHSLQYNVQRVAQSGQEAGTDWSGSPNDMFWWNSFLTQPLLSQLREPDSPWVLPCAHGSVSQIVFNVLGRRIQMLLIARRSRYFAGTRFLKRGVGDDGHVANHIEVEQIVYDHSSLSLCGTLGLFTSFVQVRGSIPIYWHQPWSDQKVHKPRPPIKLGRRDLGNSATRLHFAHLFAAYGTPIVALDLLKLKEKNPREAVLGREYKLVIDELNRALPSEERITYIPYDFRSASRAHTDKVLNEMASIAEEALSRTGVFSMGGDSVQQQRGAVRTNCVDCLDRTNLAQFLVGKCALSVQLVELGLTGGNDDCDLLPPAAQAIHEALFSLYVQMGDRIAMQYGGSKTQSAGMLGRSAVAEMWTTLHRFYNNNFVDLEKQKSINVFLGNYTPLVPRRPPPPLLADAETPATGAEAVSAVGRRYAFVRPLRFEQPCSEQEALRCTADKRGGCAYARSFPDNIKVLELRAERAAAASRGLDDERWQPQPGGFDVVPGESLHERRVIDLWDIESDYYLHLQTPRDGPAPIRLGPRWWEVPLAIFDSRVMHVCPSDADSGAATPRGSDIGTPVCTVPRAGDAGIAMRYPLSSSLTEFIDGQAVDDIAQYREDEAIARSREARDRARVDILPEDDKPAATIVQHPAERLRREIEGKFHSQIGVATSGRARLAQREVPNAEVWRQTLCHLREIDKEEVDGVSVSDHRIYSSHLASPEQLFASTALPWGDSYDRRRPWEEFAVECVQSEFYKLRLEEHRAAEWLHAYQVRELLQSCKPQNQDRIAALEQELGTKPPSLEAFQQHAALSTAEGWEQFQARRGQEKLDEYTEQLQARPQRLCDECCIDEAEALRHGRLWQVDCGPVAKELMATFMPYLASQLPTSLEDDLITLVERIRQGVTRADRMRHFPPSARSAAARAAKSTPEGLVRSEVCHSSFLARQAVDFVLANVRQLGLREQMFTYDAEPRQAVARFLNLFVEGGVFHHVLCVDARLVPFQDGFKIYRFMSDERVRVLNVSTMGVTQTEQTPTARDTVALSRRLLKSAFSVYRHFAADDDSPDFDSPFDFMNSPLCQDFARAVCQLQVANLSTLEQDADKVAFWTNVYNVLETHAQLMVGTTLEMHRQVHRCTSCYLVGGYVVSLDAIYHGILRGNRRAPTLAALTPAPLEPARRQGSGSVPVPDNTSIATAVTVPGMQGQQPVAVSAPSPPVPRHRILRPFPPGDPRRALAVKDPDPRVHFALLDLLADDLPNFVDHHVSPPPSPTETETHRSVVHVSMTPALAPSVAESDSRSLRPLASPPPMSGNQSIPRPAEEPPLAGRPPAVQVRQVSPMASAASAPTLRTPRSTTASPPPPPAPPPQLRGGPSATLSVTGSMSLADDGADSDGGSSGADSDCSVTIHDQGKETLSFLQQLITFGHTKKQILRKPPIDVVLNGADVDAQLTEITHKSLQWGTDVVADSVERTLTLPHVCFRYPEDFGYSDDEKVRRLMDLLPQRDTRKLAKFTTRSYDLKCAQQK